MKSFVLLLCSIAVALAAKDVRLITKDGVESNTEGRVEVFLNGAWGQVCSTGFSSKDASVVCRTTNGNAQGIAVSGQHGIGSDPITIGQLECNGGEQSVLDCPYTSLSTCRSGTIAAVDCNQTPRRHWISRTRSWYYCWCVHIPRCCYRCPCPSGYLPLEERPMLCWATASINPDSLALIQISFSLLAILFLSCMDPRCL